MSFTARFDNSEEYQVATTRGWNDFADWTRLLPLEDFGEIAHLVDYGWNYLTGSLLFELKQAAEKYPSDELDIAATAADLIDLVETHLDAEVIIIGQGFDGESS